MLKETLSASKIKVLKSCSWLYWCKYILKLPDKTNAGAQKGEIAHSVFECLGKPRHKKHFDKILKSGSVKSSKVVNRLIKRHIKLKGLSKDDLKDVYDMVYRGVLYDFFGERRGKPSKVVSERDFEITVDEGDVRYKVKGFIDKLFVYDDTATVLIRDFKTNKKKYEGKEVSDNLQDNIYTLAVYKLYPEYKNIKMEFVFLRQNTEEDMVMEMSAKNKYELKGFEYELTEYQKYADSFDQQLATKGFAADQGFPEDGSFGGKLLCGFAKYPGHKKKDGTPMWHCTFKFGFDCYFLIDANKKILKSAYSEEELKPLLKDGLSIIQRRYKGCPKWNNA